MIPCSNPRLQFLEHKEKITDAITRVLESGWYILGEEVKAFETEFSAYTGARYAVGVGSGTEALHMALKAINIGPGDEVVTVSHTAVATVAAIVLTGARPVFADVEPETLTIDPVSFKKKIGPRTRAVIPVHIYGHPADMDKIMSVARHHDIRVIEDCAQAHGAMHKKKMCGTIGDMGCFSFYPTKNLGALGDAGAIVTNDKKFAMRLNLFREYGWKDRYISSIQGWNSRLDEIQAAILRVKLSHLDRDNKARADVARQYYEGLSDTGMKLPAQHDGFCHVFHLYVVRTKRRDEMLKYLHKEGIGAAIHYPVPVHQQPAYTDFSNGPLHVTEMAAREILTLPMFPGLTEPDVDRIISAIRKFLS